MATSGMRWPHRSPDELRAFYSIALHPRDIDATVLSPAEESRSILAPTWSTSESIRPRSKSFSVFSGEARTVSSGTSVSDSKTIDALAPERSYGEPAGLMRLHEPIASNTEIDITRTSQFPASLVPHELNQSEEKLGETGCKRWWKADVSHRARHYVQNEAESQFARDGRATPALAEPAIEEKYWLDTLRDHPYYDLEQQTKLGRVGTWRVQRRHRDLRAGLFSTREKVNVNDGDNNDVDVVPMDSELLEKSLCESDEESIHVTEDAVSLMGSSESTLKRRRSRSVELGRQNRTLLLDLVGSQDLRHSIESDYFSVRPSTASLASTLELSSCTEQGSFHTGSRDSVRRPGLKKPVSYHCMFCFETFDHYEDWEEHEYSQHIVTQRDWICMPWGAIQKFANGDEVCVFCGHVKPSSSHGLRHNEEFCAQKSPSRRTYNCKTDFQTHVREFHDQHTLTEQMKKWSFPFEHEDWYWQCGFCEQAIIEWEDRSRHIGHHFREGFSVAAWDPVVPSFPINRNTGIAASWSSQDEMDRKRSDALRCEQEDLVAWSSQEMIDLMSCRYCKVLENDKNIRRHERVYHLPRDTWCCPTKKDARTAAHLQTGPLAKFLFPDSISSTDSNSDVCPYCWEYSERIFYDLHEDINECSADWEVRMRHLNSEHNFDQCQVDMLFFRPDQFLLHLVGFHNHKLSRWTKEVMESCKRERYVYDIKDVSGVEE